MPPRSLTFALVTLLACTGALSAPTQNGTTSQNIILRDLARRVKWEDIEPEQNQFDFGPADEILAPWVTTNLTAVELDRALQNHITKILNHYRGKLYAVDVVNELISDNTPNETFKQGIWLTKFGEDAIPKAFTYARAADPHKTVKLYINDYGIEGINTNPTQCTTSSKATSQMASLSMASASSPTSVGPSAPTLQQNLQRFADLGVDVAITELDINIGTGNPQNATAFALQAQDYWTVVNACVNVKRCVGVSVWGVSDDHSWLPNGAVLPWDKNKQPKPAFYAIADAFQGKPKPGLPTD
ncbi:glycoside hydrolase superfamily [Irpex lacteus]|nr:glycoside hydrolase superfamily [Irpex lacteus]